MRGQRAMMMKTVVPRSWWLWLKMVPSAPQYAAKSTAIRLRAVYLFLALQRTHTPLNSFLSKNLLSESELPIKSTYKAITRDSEITGLWDTALCSLVDDGGLTHLWNVGLIQGDYTVPRKLSSPYSPPWEPKISQPDIQLPVHQEKQSKTNTSNVHIAYAHVVHVDKMRLCLRTAATNGRIVHPPGNAWVWTAPVEWYWQGKTEEIGEKPVPVPLCSPQIPHRMNHKQTRAPKVAGD
jgi:hypothetical protein